MTDRFDRIEGELRDHERRIQAHQEELAGGRRRPSFVRIDARFNHLDWVLAAAFIAVIAWHVGRKTNKETA